MPLKWSCGSTVFALYHPSKDPNVDKLTSVSYEGWFFWFVCFFHLPPVSLPPHFTFIHSHCLETCLSVEAWLNTIWMTLLERSFTQFFRPHWRVGERHVGSVKKVLIFCFVFFTAPLYLQNIETICRTQCVKQNLSGHLLWGINIVVGAEIQIWDVWAHIITTDSAVSEMDKKQKRKSEKDCNYCWNMNMFKDTVKDAVCCFVLLFFHCWTQANFWTQGAVHIRGL